MFKRTLSFVIVVSMVLHCANQLGVLSYLYSQRQNIAYSIGLISEIPIALCNTDYDFHKGLSIQDHDSQNIPISFSYTHEIILFTPSEFLYLSDSNLLTNSKIMPHDHIDYYLSPHADIFHPPLLIS